VTSDDTPEKPDTAEDAPAADSTEPEGDKPERTLKDYLLEEDANFKLSPEVTARIASAMTPTMRLIAKQQNAAALKALHATEPSGALRNIKVGQNVLSQLNKANVRIPALEKLKTDLRIPALENLKTDFGISDRLGKQIAASLPTARINAQLAPLQASIARAALPKLGFALPKIPPIAFSKMYGREWAPIATKLANIQGLFDGIDLDHLFAVWFPPNWDRDRGVEQYYDFIELVWRTRNS